MIKLRQALIVEGKYDKIKLGQIFDTAIVTTDGFGVFTNDEKLQYIRRLAKQCGIIIFTDPDGGGLVIRNYLKGAVREGEVYHAYIPEVPGKERRKTSPGKEGLLGVEGVPDELIVRAVMACGIEEETRPDTPPVTKADLYELGLSGRIDSSARRRALARKIGLPGNISANGFLDAVNALYSKEELIELERDV